MRRRIPRVNQRTACGELGELARRHSGAHNTRRGDGGKARALIPRSHRSGARVVLVIGRLSCVLTPRMQRWTDGLPFVCVSAVPTAASPSQKHLIAGAPVPRSSKARRRSKPRRDRSETACCVTAATVQGLRVHEIMSGARRRDESRPAADKPCVASARFRFGLITQLEASSHASGLLL